MPTVTLVNSRKGSGRTHKSKPRFYRRYRNPTTAETYKQDGQSCTLEFGKHQAVIHTPPSVARKLECSEARVIQLIRENRLPAFRLGRVWLILECDLEEYIASRRKFVQEKYRAFLTGSLHRRTQGRRSAQ